MGVQQRGREKMTARETVEDSIQEPCDKHMELTAPYRAERVYVSHDIGHVGTDKVTEPALGGGRMRPAV